MGKQKEKKMSAAGMVLGGVSHITGSHEAHGGLDPWDVYLGRWVFIFSNVSATIFSWSAMFGTKWALANYLLAHGQESLPNSCLQRVVLALIVSFVAFVVIRFLDVLQDMDSTGHHADAIIHALIESLSILVGFSWEQSFDAGVEDIIEVIPKDQPIKAACIKLSLAFAVAVILIPAWRTHLLKKTLKEEEHHPPQEQGVPVGE